MSLLTGRSKSDNSAAPKIPLPDAREGCRIVYRGESRHGVRDNLLFAKTQDSCDLRKRVLDDEQLSFRLLRSMVSFSFTRHAAVSSESADAI